MRVAIAIQVDVVEGMTVPRQEFLHSEGPSAVRRADHDHVTEIVRNQLEPAQDERPHDDLAQLSVGLNQRQQRFPIQLKHFAGLADAQTCERATTAYQGGFAQELPGLKADQFRVSPLSAGRSACSSPLITTKTGAALSPTPMSTSPRIVERRRPRDAILPTCACGEHREHAVEAEKQLTASGVSAGSPECIESAMGPV